MSISLVKGGNLSLTKAAPDLGAITMGLGWDARTTTGVKFDLDASALGVGENGKVLSDQYFIFFNQKTSPEGAIEHRGDNRDGEGGGDDEVITVDLGRLPAEAHALVFTVNSFRGQKFTDVRNAYCRLLDLESGAELVRYDLTESERSTGVIMSVLVRSGPAWDMTAIGEFHDGKTARAMYEPAERVVRTLV